MPEKDIQTITFDDFEKSLQEAGIEVIIPETDEDIKLDGIGATGYTPRLSAPSYTNPYYLKQGYGGYNRCILIQGKSCLPNCVGYAFGRSLEIGKATSNTKLPTCNAEDWLSVAKTNGLKTGSSPKLGAVIVWKSGSLWNGNDGCGHVGVVEAVNADGTITVSQSNYGGTRFFLTKHKPPYDILGQKFIGFIYSPYILEEGVWRQDETGWWYDNGDGSYPINQWKEIKGKWYFFDTKGYMKTGWVMWKNNWYYLQKDGSMLASSWLQWNGSWYFLGKDGAMFVGKHSVPVMFDSSGRFMGNWPKES